MKLGHHLIQGVSKSGQKNIYIEGTQGCLWKLGSTMNGFSRRGFCHSGIAFITMVGNGGLRIKHEPSLAYEISTYCFHLSKSEKIQNYDGGVWIFAS